MAESWQNHKTLLYAWLLIFFPIGLYGLWTGSLFDTRKKWMITGGVVLVFLLTGAGFNALLALILAPLAVILLWKDTSIQRPTVYKFGAGAAVIFLLFIAAPAQQGDDCTYFRDSNYNVFARSCG